MAAPGSAFCVAHVPAARAVKVAERVAKDQRRGSAASRGYGHKWGKASRQFRRQHPICGGYVVPGPAYSHDLAVAYAEQRSAYAVIGRAVTFLQSRAAWLAESPVYVLVTRCLSFGTPGCGAPATLTDHIVPHRGDPELMWSSWNWQTLCKGCHDQKTAKHDGGFRGAKTPEVSRRGAECAEAGIV